MKMNFKRLLLPVILVLIFILGIVFKSSSVSKQKVTNYPVVIRNDSAAEVVPATERYSARVDRVDVVFEHWDYTRFRLQTNGLIREGYLKSERSFAADPDAMVYVLNAHKPVGEQIHYVKLTAEPTFLYMLDSANEIIRGGKLQLQ